MSDHCQGSTDVFRLIWKQIADRLPHYKDFPRIVGETGGKDYIFAHASANVDQVFELKVYNGKVSGCSC